MELENQVPENITKRKFIADLLNIPPMLLGLGVLEDITLKPHPEVKGAFTKAGYTTQPKVVADTTKYQNNIRMFWTLHDTTGAYSRINEIQADISELESLASQARGDLLYHTDEILFSYHILMAHLVRDQRDFSTSHYYANQAVRIGRTEHDSDLTATALYTRGCTYLEWGMFSKLKQGVFEIQKDKIDNAIRDFEEAIRTPEKGIEGLHPQLLGFIRLHLSRAYAIAKLSNGEQIPAFVIQMLDDVADNIGQQTVEDPYQRILVTGHYDILTWQGLYSARASAFNAGGMGEKALEAIRAIDNLQHETIGRDNKRHYTWKDIITANAHMNLGQFEKATRKARRAAISSGEIQSFTSITNLVDIHGQILRSPYGNEPSVTELGEILQEMIKKHKK